MRLPLIIAVLLVLSLPVVPAPAPVVPAMAVQVQPETQDVEAKNQSVELLFNGTVNVSANQFTDMGVALSSEVDAGWGSGVVPALMQFTGSGSQKFTANVTVPAKANGSANLTVTVRGTTRVLTLTAEVVSVINVAGAANQSSNRTVPGIIDDGTGPVRFAGLDPAILGAAVTATVIVVAGGGGFLLLRRRKAKRLAAASLPA